LQENKPVSNIYENYLVDLGYLLGEYATEASRELKAVDPKVFDGKEYQFRLGRVMAYYEVLTTFVHQAETFGIPVSKLGIQDLDIERLLVQNSKNAE
jgi:hypothetical protein